MADVINFESIEDKISNELSAKLATAFCTAIIEDDEIDLSDLIAHAKRVAKPDGIVFSCVWSGFIETLSERIREAKLSLDASGVLHCGDLEVISEKPGIINLSNI